jgi:hypothetical protein
MDSLKTEFVSCCFFSLAAQQQQQGVGVIQIEGRQETQSIICSAISSAVMHAQTCAVCCCKVDNIEEAESEILWTGTCHTHTHTNADMTRKVLVGSGGDAANGVVPKAFNSSLVYVFSFNSNVAHHERW